MSATWWLDPEERQFFFGGRLPDQASDPMGGSPTEGHAARAIRGWPWGTSAQTREVEFAPAGALGLLAAAGKEYSKGSADPDR